MEVQKLYVMWKSCVCETGVMYEGETVGCVCVQELCVCVRKL